MRVWVKVLAWTGVVLVGLGALLFVLGPALFASVAYPLPQEYRQTLCDEAKNFNVEPKLLAGLIFTESRWNPTAQSGAGAQGLTQFISGTANSVAKTLDVENFTPSRLKTEPLLAIRFGAYYLGDLVNRRYGGNKIKALIAYNGGGGAVIGYEQGYPFKGTLAYANKVIAVGDMYENIYGDWCNRADLPDLSAKPQNPTDLLTTINIGDFWKGLLSNEVATDSQPDTTNNSKSFDFGAFWQKLISN